MFSLYKSTNIAEEIQYAMLVMQSKFAVAKKAVLCVDFLNINCAKYLFIFTITWKKFTSAVDKYQNQRELYKIYTEIENTDVNFFLEHA